MPITNAKLFELNCMYLFTWVRCINTSLLLLKAQLKVIRTKIVVVLFELVIIYK